MRFQVAKKRGAGVIFAVLWLWKEGEGISRLLEGGKAVILTFQKKGENILTFGGGLMS